MVELESYKLWVDNTLNKINETLLNFSPDPGENIKKLVETAGSVLGGTCALYNKENGAFLYTVAGWNIPEDFKWKDKKNGHICHEVIARGQEEPFIINHLDKTDYARTDPNVIKYKIKTYLGAVVKVGGQAVGSLCVAYQEDKTLNVNAVKILSILAKAIGVEEERRRAGEALEVSERKFRGLFDNAMDGILLADAENKKFYMANKTIGRMLGYSPEEIKNLGVMDIHPREDLPRIIEQFEKQLNKEISVARDVPVKRKDGSIFYADINASAIKADGKTYLMGIFRDITERKDAEKMLKEKNIALGEIIKQVEVEKDKMKDDIAANVNKLLFPILARLKTRKVPHKYINLLQRHLEELTSSFGRKITEKSVRLTPREIEICSMIKGGLASKEISKLLNISYQTVEKHRKNIRHKIGISNKDVNLTSFLHTF